MKTNKLEIDIDIQKSQEHLPNAASVFLDKQESFNQMRASDKVRDSDKLRDSASLGPSLKIDQQAVKVVIHQDLGSSVNSNPVESSQEQLLMGTFHQIRDQKHTKLEEILETQLTTNQTALHQEAQQPIQVIARENLVQTNGMNTIQLESAKNQSPHEVQEQQDSQSFREKKRPRKRYFNGHGKVPGKVDAIQKDPNARMSRALSGKSWTRSGNKGTSLSSRSGVGMLTKDPSALTQTHSFRPYQGQFALNLGNSDAISQLSPSNYTPINYRHDNQPTVTSLARQRGIKILSDEDQETEFETLNSRNNIHGQKIKVKSNQVTLDPNVAIQLARDGAIIGLQNAYNEVEGLSKAAPSDNDNGLLFTLDQYKWAQRQNIYERKDSIGKNSIGRQIHTAHTRVKRPHQSFANLYPPQEDKSIAPSDFIVEEAAVSHLMHRADNIPKIKFQLVCDQDETTADEPSHFGPVPSFQMARGSIPYTQRTAPKGPIATHSNSVLKSVVQPNTGLMSPIGRFLMSDTDEDQVQNQGNQGPGESIQVASAELFNSNIGTQANSRQITSFRPHRSQQGARPVRGTINSDIYRTTNMQQIGLEIQRQDIGQNDLNLMKNLSPQNSRQQSPYRIYSQRVNHTNLPEKLSPTAQNAIDSQIQQSLKIKNSIENEQPETGNVMYKRTKSYHYQPLEGELDNKDVEFSSGNIYDISKNPSMAKLLSSVQKNIAVSHMKRYDRRMGKDRVQGMFKKSQSCFHKTLLVGEEQGHCEGISQRNAPTRMYQNRLKTLRFLQKQAERYEEIRAKRPQVLQARRQAQQERTTQKIYKIDQAKKIVPDWVKSSNPRPSQGQIRVNEPILEDKLDPSALRPPKPTIQVSKPPNGEIQQIQTQSNVEIQPNTNKQEVANLMDQSAPDISKVIASAEESRASIAVTQQNSPSPQKSENDDIPKDFSTTQIVTQPKPSLSTTNSPAKQRKLALNNARKLKQLRENLGLKNILPEQAKALEQHLSGQTGVTTSPTLFGRTLSNAPTALQKIYKYLQSDQFITFKQSHNRQPGVIPKRNPIFKATEQLGLEDRPDFQQFFLALCGDTNSHNPKLERLKYKEFLQDRYSRIVGEKALLFFENKFQTLFTFDKRGYCNVLMEFLNSGPELYKRLLFGCLTFSSSSFVCEHDIFLLLENFKQRDSYYFYKELISQKNVPRDFADAIDGSDDTFFEAFASDVKAIARALALRKRICGITDSDTAQGFEDDISPSSFSSEEVYEEFLVNQIDYVIGVILKSTSSASVQQEIAGLLISHCDLKALKSALIKLAVRLDVKATREKKTDASLLAGTDAKRPCQVPCLGANIVAASGKKIQTECCFLSFEDFNKLVTFKKGQHSSFVEDLIDHMTNSLISVHDVEMWLSSYREPTCRTIFSGQTLLEHVAQMNVKHYGNTRGLPPLQAKVKKLRMGIAPELVAHKITTPFTVQDHYMGEDFVGKLLIRKIPAKEAKSVLEQTEGEDKAKEDELGKSPERAGESGDERDQEEGRADGGGSPGLRQKDRQVLNTTLINETVVYELIRFRAHFGAPNFFRIFRLFYQLSNIPDDAQNNPFALYLDESSITRNFESVFGVKNEEVAVRFFRLFIAPLDQPKMYKIDVCRWYFVVQHLTDNSSPKTNKNFLRLAFNFLDYDSNGNIGSVDILNLKRSLNEGELEAVERVFYLISVRKQLGAKMKKRFVEGAERRKDAKKKPKSKSKLEPSEEESVSLLSNQGLLPKLKKKATKLEIGQEKIEDKPIAAVQEDNGNSQKSETDSEDGSDQEEADPELALAAYEAGLSDFERMTRDPWNCFQMEVQILRDHYVEEAVKTQNPKTTDYEFLNLKRYELQFLPMLAQRFEVETPTMVHFFKKTLIYEFEFSEGLKEEKGSNYHGYTKRGYRMPREATITPELLQMQQMLDSMSRTPRPQNLDLNHNY